MTASRRLALGACALGVVAGVLVPASARAAGPVGDPTTIAYVKAIDANTDAQRGMQILQTGYMTLASRGGSHPVLSYRWGFGTVPAGSVRAKETITYAQSGGRVAWLDDVLTPNVADCAASPTCRRTVPLELVVTRTGAFAGVIDGPNDAVSCFHRESFDAVPYRAGGRWWSAVGDYRPMVERGNQRLVTDTYAWADAQHVTEIDSIDVATRLFAASSFHVARGSSSAEPAFGFAQGDTALTTTPTAPKVLLCT